MKPRYSIGGYIPLMRDVGQEICNRAPVKYARRPLRVITMGIFGFSFEKRNSFVFVSGAEEEDCSQ